MHFNPRAPCGARHITRACKSLLPYFNPRAPCGARLHDLRRFLVGQAFQSTRPVWGATRAAALVCAISTHFNPRAPCGARQRRASKWGSRGTFQSTRPVWGATLERPASIVAKEFQSTRPVWGATPEKAQYKASDIISIHAPRVGRDEHERRRKLRNPRFQSTRPVWGATLSWKYAAISCMISIHAPRVGRDSVVGTRHLDSGNFNPRAPCGARQVPHNVIISGDRFQSTRPVWGATDNPTLQVLSALFQSTRPRGARRTSTS